MQPPFVLKTPRPDITWGLSSSSLETPLAATNALSALQESDQLITDPHSTQSGLRFPFLIVESKSGATGANLYQAQNQAAVSCAGALIIQHELGSIVEEVATAAVPALLSNAMKPPGYCVFSVVNEGPVFELWIHFERTTLQQDGTPMQAYHSSCIDVYRTTVKQSARKLVDDLCAVFHWAHVWQWNDMQQKLRQILNVNVNVNG